MKILQVGSSMPDDWGGIERYVSVLCAGLAERGHEVTLAAPAGSPLTERTVVPSVPVRVKGKYDFAAVAAYLRLFRERRFDVVNTHFSPDYLVPAWAARITKQPGMVLTRHLVLPVKRSRVRAYSRLYDHVIGVSGAAGAELVRSGFAESKVSVARAGLPALVPQATREECRARLGMAPGEFAVGVFGRLTPEKGHALLFEAVRRLPVEVVCHVFGRGPSLDDLTRQAQTLGGQVRLHGYVADVAEAMDACDAIAMPSIWAEALGMALLEALSLGKPIVASPVGGIPEVIDDGENGLLADPYDSESFAAAIQRFVEDDGFRDRCSQAAKALHASEYTRERFAERIEAVYSRVVSRQPTE